MWLWGRLSAIHRVIAIGVRVHLGAVNRDHPHRHQAGVRAQRQDLANEAPQRPLLALGEARDRVIGPAAWA